MDSKAPDAFRTISEVAEELDLPQHVLRFWESRFGEIRPMKRGGGRRYYRPDDIDTLRGVRHLLYGEGYTIRGVQRILREQGLKFVQMVWRDGAPQPQHDPAHDVSEDAQDGQDTASAATPEFIAGPKRGLLGRLPSLLGRDLGDDQDDAAERNEPPMQSAPMPRVDAGDRAPSYQPSAPPQQPVAAERLSADKIGRLHAALHELGECKKLIDAALARE